MIPKGTHSYSSYGEGTSTQNALKSAARSGNRVGKQTPSKRREGSEQTKAWMEYAEGGHEEADKEIQAIYAKRLIDEERKRKDDEMELALFGPTEIVTDVAKERKVDQTPDVDVLQESPSKMVIRESV